MDTLPPPASPTSAATVQNPHVFWRQLVGLVFWAGLFSFVAGGPIGGTLCLALGGATFADAWVSGIYKRPGRRTFLNMSPMSWGIGMALLFIIIYPIYLFNRNKLRTIHGTNDFYWATIGLGAVLVALLIINIVVRSVMPPQ